MRLTHFTDLTLRVLMYLGLTGNRLVPVSEIVRQFNMPENHARKVVNALATLGYVSTQRGKKGGIRLARPPGDITLGQVVRETEPLQIIDCGGTDCPVIGRCALNVILDQAAEGFLSHLDGFTVAHLVTSGSGVHSLLKDVAGRDR
jgi:Rrf2 family nitric oxide-sensitive transcriptional repressor